MRKQDTSRLDTRDPVMLIRRVEKLLRELNGKPVNDANVKLNSAEMAQLSRDLMFAAHMLDQAKILVMNEWHVMKGQTDHLVDGVERS